MPRRGAPSGFTAGAPSAPPTSLSPAPSSLAPGPAPSSPHWASGTSRDALWAPRRSGRAVLAVTLRACRRVHRGKAWAAPRGLCPARALRTARPRGPARWGPRCPRSFLRSRCARGPRLELAPLPADVDVALALGGPRGSVAGPLPLACRSVFGSRKQQTGEDVSHRGRYRRSAEAAARGSQAGGRAGSAGAWRRSLRQLHGHTPRSRSAVGLGHRRHPRKKPCPV